MKRLANSLRNSYSLFVYITLGCTFLLWQFSPNTQSSVQKNQDDLANYDIRNDKSELAKRTIAKFIEQSAGTDSSVKSERRKTARAIAELRSKNANLKIEFNDDLRIPEVISPDYTQSGNFLSAQSDKKRADVLRDFLKQNSDLFGLTESRINQFKTTADYTNPDGNLSFVHLEQTVHDVPVFRGEVKAGFTRKNEIIRVINNIAPNLDDENLSCDFGNAERAITIATRFIKSEPLSDKTTAEKIYFPIDYGVARAAWRVLFWTKLEAFYVIVDAETGTLLWRKNLTESQTQPATYNVYGNPTSVMKTADSPTPFTPGCTNPNNCPQPPIVNRQSFTLIGNEPPYTFNNNGWIPDGETRTIGNAAEAGIDRDGTQGVDPNGWAFGNPNRNFVYAYNPAPGSPPPGEEPLPTTQTYPPSQFQQGSITHAFYAVNRWHDETYLLGFTEAARNFQADNFGRGGLANDSISVEVQDGSGTNGANFSTPADGGRPRLQLFVWTGSTPARDGALDSQTVVHELTHGLSNRLHGNGSGLGNQGGMMGEGWSDWYAIALLSEPTDDVNGVYSIACYSILALGIPTLNCYHGIRRFPMARKSVLGPNGLPHNPLTFGHLNANCDTTLGTTTTNPSSAYPRNPAIATFGNCSQVHNAGEIWAIALWEVRGFLIDAHGTTEGNRRALQYVTDGMKLAPLNPTMLQERDAIIAATAAVNPNDVIHVRRGFAVRGMGASAQVISSTQVIEAFDVFPNVVQTPNFTFTDIIGNNNGFPEPGETLSLTIPLTNNNTGVTITDVNLQVVGGGSAFYGDIANGQTVTRNINYTVPVGTLCGSLLTLTFNINSSSGSYSVNREIRIGVPVGGAPVTFSNNTALTIPSSGASMPYGTTVNVSGLTGNKKLKLELSGITHTFPGDLDFLLVGPGNQKYIFLSDSGSTGDVSNLTLTLSDTAATQPSTTQWVAGEFRPYNAGANDAFPAPAPSSSYTNASPAGTDTFVSVFGTSSTNLNGTWTLYVVDDAGGDEGMISGGWSLTFESDDYTCIVCSCLPKQRADFDGDGRSDISVYRPSEGNWYLNRSTNGFTAITWGISGDVPTPGDYDGDGKTDLAVFRADANSANPDFYILNSSTSTFSGFSWGAPADIPVIEDYDGDNKDDVAVYRPSSRTFYVLKSGNGSALTFSRIPPQSFRPVAGDFDGDGKGDFTVFGNGQWLISKSSDNYNSALIEFWGLDTDKLVSADYDGDGKDDLAVFRPSDGVWYIRKSSGGNTIVQFGLSTDIPVPADYDGDGRADIAVYRGGTWWINRSSLGLLTTQFGLTGDIPIPNRYLP